MCKSSSQAKQVANMFKGKIGGGRTNLSEVSKLQK